MDEVTVMIIYIKFIFQKWLLIKPRKLKFTVVHSSVTDWMYGLTDSSWIWTNMTKQFSVWYTDHPVSWRLTGTEWTGVFLAGLWWRWGISNQTSVIKLKLHLYWSWHKQGLITLHLMMMLRIAFNIRLYSMQF